MAMTLPGTGRRSAERRRRGAQGGDALARRRERFLLLMLLPATLVVLALIAWPIALTAQLSLYDVRLFDILRGRTETLTLDNYRKIFADPAFARALGTTLFYSVASTAIAFVWGLCTALVLQRRFPGRTLTRIAIISPWVIPASIASLIWMFLFDGHVGLVNYVLLSLGLMDEPVAWLVDQHLALWSVIIASVWKSYPFFTVMLLAGLQAVPKSMIEAARVDGAGRLARLWDITFPSLSGVIAISLFLSLLASFREVETILVMTGGEPGRATETLSLLIYNETFEAYRAGRGAALGVIAFALSLALMLIGFRSMARSMT